jgi:hypothetical protein
MLCLATPFAWIGACLCAKRLRSVNGPVWLVVLFFVPILKWFLFAFLCISPAQPPSDKVPLLLSESEAWRWLPKTAAGSAIAAIAIAAAVGAAVVLVSVNLFRSYGSTLFLGAPFYIGFLSALIYNAGCRRSLWQSIGAGLIALLFVGAILLAIATEGFVCLVMAAPLAFWESVIGSIIAHSLTAAARRQSATMLSATIVLPFLFATETMRTAPLRLRSVTSEVAIASPPGKVWSHVVSFAEIPPPKELIFRAGISYPQRARIDGQGVGAVRHCVFSTGEFVEPITAWEEPSRLAFDVSAQPDPLTELSPYRNLRTPHLHGYFESKKGEFQLRRTKGGGTLLRGTTWYAQKFEPNVYWNFWSDFMIHRIHMRVLQHIKSECERN